MDQFTLILGLVASIYGLLMRIPQIYKIIVTKSATDLSYVSIFIGCSSEVLWFAYGYMQNDISIISSSSGHFTIVMTLLLIKCYYDRKKRLEIQDN
tara:strand:- start:620 stop:907 length:288 start_codon:yes stop_codon:yes gene_type:complete